MLGEDVKTPLELFTLYFGSGLRPEGANKILISKSLLDAGLGEALSLRRNGIQWQGSYAGFDVTSRLDVEFVKDPHIETIRLASLRPLPLGFTIESLMEQYAEQIKNLGKKKVIVDEKKKKAAKD